MAGTPCSSRRSVMIGAFARPAARCIEISENMALKDEVQRQKLMIEHLLKQTKEKDAEIEEKKLQLKKVRKLCDDYIDDVGSSTTLIRKIVSGNLGPEYGSVIVDVMDVSKDVERLGFETAEVVKFAAGNPGDDEDDDGPYTHGQFPGWYEAGWNDDDEDDEMHWDAEVYDYDSDGRPIDYEV